MRVRVTPYLFAATFLLFFANQGEVSGEEIYRYIDKYGVAHYTNVPTDGYKPVSLSRLATPQEEGISFRTPTVRSADRKDLKLHSGRHWKYTNNTKFDKHIRHAARAHKVDPLLIKAIIKTESAFNRYAVSPKGAKGLMQLMPATAKDLKVKDPFDPRQNIYGGTKYIKWLLKRFNGDLRLSLAAYNAGPARVKKKIPRIPETIAYVSKVLRYYKAYKKGGKKRRAAYQPAIAMTTSIRVREMVTVN
ncbi:MAG: transglycosylase SLT domain-containing protein [Candidatus Electrothrix aestuarii]|uniref:Transglycosylase SLT domain-containing protein n=1 Tax=Candidatus Electrothrix aestuarii TaxID=3062594 RepID=A0AAU8LZT6_9BACT|nr:transglycosylase SLT domain-containing protein [Candidatus Electrothrix aestuarii]WPD23443.1 MAG: transglycosylase SLT domain-containing protein [Candidatus Electrothrix sp. GW3-3]